LGNLISQPGIPESCRASLPASASSASGPASGNGSAAGEPVDLSNQARNLRAIQSHCPKAVPLSRPTTTSTNDVLCPKTRRRTSGRPSRKLTLRARTQPRQCVRSRARSAVHQQRKRSQTESRNQNEYASLAGRAVPQLITRAVHELETRDTSAAERLLSAND